MNKQKEEFVNSIVCCSGGKLNEYILREYLGDISETELYVIRKEIAEKAYHRLLEKIENDEL